jgi:hypothetical protein
MDIRILQQSAMLGVKTTYPKLELKTSSAVVQRNPGSVDLKIRRTEGGLKLDSSPAREAIGYYSPKAFTRMIAQKGNKVAMEGIGRRAAEGSEMVDVHKNGFVIPDIAERNAWKDPVKVEIAPKPRPRMSYTPDKIQMDVQASQDQYAVSRSQYDSHLNWGHVEVYIRQQNQIKVDWTGNLLDLVR